MKRHLSFFKTAFSLRKFLLTVLLLLIAAQVFILFRLQVPAVGLASSTDTLQGFADQVFATCKTVKYRPTCYDEQIPKLMKTISMEDAFAVTRMVQDMDPTYTYCHVLGHKLSSIEVAKDPSKWKEVVTRCPSGACSNGCIHGGFEERFRKQMFSDQDIEKYKPDLEGICEERSDWHPTGVEQASCYHALGHLAMYITNGEITKALPLCKQIAKKDNGRDFTVLCNDGAFMQIFQPLEFDDFALVEGKQPTKETVFSFCSRFSLAEQASCINESWPLFKNEIMTPQGFLEHCSHSPTEFGKNYCYMALSYIVTPKLQFDPQKTAAFCGALTEEASLVCYKFAATRIIENDTRNLDKAVALCTSAKNDTQKNTCFEELATKSSYYLGAQTEKRRELCTLLPTKWQKVCKK